MSRERMQESHPFWVSKEEREHKIRSSVVLFAFGDAWGFVTEFMDHSKILKKMPDVPKLLKVSDDTQMSLYTMRALKKLSQEGIDLSQDYYDISSDETLQNHVRQLFAEQYVRFAHDPDNNRAPGMTCLDAISKYETACSLGRVTRGDEGARNTSLGCGTIMRTPWIGLLPYSEDTIATLAILQAQSTHGDPVGWIVSAICSLMVRSAMGETEPQGSETEHFSLALSALETVENLNPELTKTIRDHKVGIIDPFEKVRSALTAFADSWDGITARLLPLEADAVDVSTIFGEGWIADEALYSALGVLSLYGCASEENILYGIKRLVYTNGDSDSVAAVGGALFGAESALGTIRHEKLEQISMLFEDRYRMETEEAISFINTQWNKLSDGTES